MVLLSLLSSSVGWADSTLVSDPLTRPATGTATLAGTQPTVDVGGGTWAQDLDQYVPVFKTSLLIGATAGPGAANTAYLPIEPITTGQIYTLDITISGGAGIQPGDIGYLGFDNSTADTNLQFYSIAGPWVELGATGADLKASGATNTMNNGGGTPFNGLMGPNDLTLVLNTESAQWTVSGFLNGTLLKTDVYTTNPVGLNSIAISQVVGGGTGDQVQFSNLTLTTSGILSTPEPSTWAFLISGLGCLGLYLRGRNRSRD